MIPQPWNVCAACGRLIIDHRKGCPADSFALDDSDPLDLDALSKLAEALRGANDSLGDDWYRALKDWQEATNPTTILALIARVRKAEAALAIIAADPVLAPDAIGITARNIARVALIASDPSKETPR